MPCYVKMSRIDWHYDHATPELQAILRDANLNLSSRDHTAQTFEEQLRKVAADSPDLLADALTEDGFRGYWLFRAREGRVVAAEVEQRPEGGVDRQVELPLDEVATVVLIRQAAEIRSMLEEQGDFDGGESDEIELPLRYENESSMREVLDRVAKAIDEGEHRFVAEVDLERFLVEIFPGTASVRRLVVMTEPNLVARLLQGQFPHVPEPPPRADEKREQSLYWPQDMLQTIKDEAFRLDTSLSNIVQKAWKTARLQVAASDRETLSPLLRGFSGEKAKQTVLLPGDMLVEIREQAARLDASLSFVVQSAWALAHDTIAALPAPEDE
jgi:uncharacterized small protein (TIGR04563 family)